MKVLRIIGSIFCFLIVLYAGWISMWVLTRGRIPFGPIIFAILSGCGGAALLRGALGISEPDTEVERQLRLCRTRYSELFGHLQEVVLQRRPALAEVGFKISDWGDGFLRQKQARLGSRFDSVVLTVTALREADRRINRVLWTDGTPLTKSEQLNALRRAQASLDKAERGLAAVVSQSPNTQNGQAQESSPAFGAGPIITVDLGRWTDPPAQDGDKV